MMATGKSFYYFYKVLNFNLIVERCLASLYI
jgi:hypothetical protein